MVNITFSDSLCKGCGLCVRNCPKKLIEISASKLNAKGYRTAGITDAQACTACAACARTCPDIAIRIEKE